MENTRNPFRSGIFIMVKYPELGMVKERLAQSVGEEAAIDLYRAFIQDTLQTVQSLDIPYHIAVYPPASQERFAQWLGPSHQFFGQEGVDLGQRLQNGFATMYKKEYQQVIALASDSPDLPIEILQKAVSSLQTHKVVIGPASDGGYYLIGFSHDLFISKVFEDIPWSTATVFRETLSRIESVTSQVHVLPEWADIDTKSDLQKFYETCQLQPSKILHTMKYLRSHSKLLQILFS
ncbi:MAG: TIGR04282 family arsenosugar biosynthesis glycosyltransferase [Candidatus Thorarchaeota archaeon]|nr:TIGR04282 family arsenosugar biosynthesis glycosyltransferase [Candidatus Thorarchaeota archaeon]